MDGQQRLAPSDAPRGEWNLPALGYFGAALLLWALACFIVRCARLTAYSQVCLWTLMQMMGVRVAVAVAALVFSVAGGAVAFACPSGLVACALCAWTLLRARDDCALAVAIAMATFLVAPALWMGGIANVWPLVGIACGGVDVLLTGRASLASLAPPLVDVVVGAACGAAISGWQWSAAAWLAISATCLCADARTYGRLSPTDAARLAIDAYALLAAGAIGPDFHWAVAASASVAWTLRACDSAFGARRFPGAIPPPVHGIVHIQSAAHAAEGLYASSLVVASMGAQNGGSSAVLCALALAITLVTAEERLRIVHSRCEPTIARLVAYVRRDPPMPRGRMALRVRAPSKF